MLSTFVDTMAQKYVCLCVHATHDVRTLCTRSHINTPGCSETVVVVALCCLLFSDAGC